MPAIVTGGRFKTFLDFVPALVPYTITETILRPGQSVTYPREIGLRPPLLGGDDL